MASDYGGNYRLQSTHILHSAGVSEPLPFGQDLVRMQHQHLQGGQLGLSSHPQPHPYPHPHFYPYPYHPYPHTQLPLHPPHHHLYSAESHDLHQAIVIEIEKERIRQEIIISEIIRRRGLEAEVERELMMDREMALQGRSNGSLEKRIMLPLTTQKDMLNNTHEGGGSESLPFQRASNYVRTAGNSEDKPVLEGSNEKKKIILQVTPIENIIGAKRARSGPDASESETDGKLKKKAKEEWSCAICHVSSPNERMLNEHLGGKRHKKNEAALIAQKAGKNSSQRVGSNKDAKSIDKGSGTSNPVTDSEVKHASQSLPFGRNGDDSSRTDGSPPLLGNLNSINLLKKDKLVVLPQEVQDTNQPKKRFRCEICQISVGSQRIMDVHEQGKKHKRRLKLSNGISITRPSNQKEGGAAR